jgi:choice-of-anchor C domain-containing protein
MKRRSISSILVAMMAMVILASPVSAALPFANGGFENGTFAVPGGFKTLESGATDISNWVVGTGDIQWIKSEYWAAHTGDKSIDLSGDEPGSIYQDLETTPGAWYFVTFWIAGNTDSGPVQKVAEVSVPGRSQLYTFDITGKSRPGNMGWTQEEFIFRASTTETRLTFTGVSGGAFGAAIDDVVVVQVLYGATDCKNGGWMTMQDSTYTPFKNQGDCVSYYATGERNLANPKDDA